MPFLTWLKSYAFIAKIMAACMVIGAIVIAFERNNSKHEAIGYVRANSEWLVKESAAKQSALAKEREYIQQKETAQYEAAQRQIELEASIADLRRQLDSLRFAAGEMRKRIATLTVDAARHVADTGLTVFSECANQYTEVAVIADQCLSERQTLIEAWPK